MKDKKRYDLLCANRAQAPACFLSRAMMLLVVLFYFSCPATTQQVYLRKGKKTIELRKNSWIGLTTSTDTILYWGQKNLSFEIYDFDSSQVFIRRPLAYYDTVIEYYSGVYPSLSFEFQVGKFFRENKKDFVHLLKIDSFEKRSFSYDNLTSITYPEARKGDGCVGCFFVPGLNIWYIASSLKKTRAMKRDIPHWQIIAER